MDDGRVSGIRPLTAAGPSSLPSRTSPCRVLANENVTRRCGDNGNKSRCGLKGLEVDAVAGLSQGCRRWRRLLALALVRSAGCHSEAPGGCARAVLLAVLALQALFTRAFM